MTHREALESVVAQCEDAVRLRETWGLVARLHNIARTAAAALSEPAKPAPFAAEVAGGTLTVFPTGDGRLTIAWEGNFHVTPQRLRAAEAYDRLLHDWPWTWGQTPAPGQFREAVRDVLGGARPDPARGGRQYGAVTITPLAGE